LFATGAPFLRIAYGRDYDAAAVQRGYESFITNFVVDGLRSRRKGVQSDSE
jgi:hypothetical protein